MAGGRELGRVRRDISYVTAANAIIIRESYTPPPPLYNVLIQVNTGFQPVSFQCWTRVVAGCLTLKQHRMHVCSLLGIAQIKKFNVHFYEVIVCVCAVEVGYTDLKDKTQANINAVTTLFTRRQ